MRSVRSVLMSIDRTLTHMRGAVVNLLCRRGPRGISLSRYYLGVAVMSTEGVGGTADHCAKPTTPSHHHHHHQPHFTCETDLLGSILHTLTVTHGEGARSTNMSSSVVSLMSSL